MDSLMKNSLMDSKMVVPVTKQLKDALNTTERLLTALDDEKARARYGLGLNDRDHYTRTVEELEALTVAVLAAPASAPLTGMGAVVAARFDMGAGTSLARMVTECVAYLRDTATGLLAAGDFNAHQSEHVVLSSNMLKMLNGKILAAIVRQAEVDLTTLRNTGVTHLLAAADRLASLATGKVILSDNPPTS